VVADGVGQPAGRLELRERAPQLAPQPAAVGAGDQRRREHLGAQEDLVEHHLGGERQAALGGGQRRVRARHAAAREAQAEEQRQRPSAERETEAACEVQAPTA
jgi:hypothetical protein